MADDNAIDRGRDFDVVVIGDLCVDLILTGDVIPEFGQAEKLVDTATMTIGGSATIFACGAARLGLVTAMIGVVGTDDFGAFMRREVAARGVDLGRLTVDPAIQTALSVHLAHGKDRAILTYSGTIGGLRRDHLDLALLSRARHLHLGCYFLLDNLRADVPRLFEHAHSLGLTTSLDTNYDPTGRWADGLDDVLAHTDLFFPNEVEARAIAGLDDVEAAALALAARGPLVVVKLGPDGSLAATAGGATIREPGLPVEVVDTAGAGDSFDAGFLHAWLAGRAIDRCLRLGNACGALSTRRAGGTQGQASLEEARAFAGDDLT